MKSHRRKCQVGEVANFYKQPFSLTNPPPKPPTPASTTPTQSAPTPAPHLHHPPPPPPARVITALGGETCLLFFSLSCDLCFYIEVAGVGRGWGVAGVWLW